jgi:hypothetical protein
VARKKSVFVVSRLNWRPIRGGEWWLGFGTARLESFPTFDEADTERARREANARSRVNPFRCCKPLDELTTLPEPIFLDWVGDTGLSPPKAKKGEARDWVAWWDATRSHMSAEQHARLWEGLNKLHFFRVDERPDEPVGYVLVEAVWQQDGGSEWMNEEGGEVRGVYPTRERAAEDGRKLRVYEDRESRAWHPTCADLFDPETFWEVAVHRGPQFDVAEIELEGSPRPGATLYLVTRCTWHPKSATKNWDEAVPIRGFAKKKEAESHCAVLEAEFRREHDPQNCFGEQWGDEEWNRLREAAVRTKLFAADAQPDLWSFPTPTPEQRAALWTAVPGWTVYEVVETKFVK